MEDGKLQETPGAKLEYTRIKLLAGALLSILFLVFMAFIAYGSVQKILYSMDDLSKPRKETRWVQELVSGISEVQNNAETYAVTMSPEDLNEYIEKRTQVRILIDSLRHSIGKKDYYTKVDSLHFLFDQYSRSLNEWLFIKSSNPKGAMAQLMETLEAGDSSLASRARIPKEEVTTVTTTIEKTVIENKETKELDDKDKNKSFFRRFFGGKSDKEDSLMSVIPQKTIEKKVVTETTVKQDTGYYQQVDTLLDKMKASITRAELVKKRYNQQLKQRSIELMRNNLLLTRKVNILLKNIDREEYALAQQKVALSRINIQSSYRQLIFWGIAGGLFALLFVVLLFRDISKNLRYKRMLQEATKEARKHARVKEEFLANMSHEIRTPLNSIIGYADQLSAVPAVHTHVPPVNILANASQHLLQMVNDVLDYSKLESSVMPLEKIGFTADRVSIEVIQVLQSEAQRKGLRLKYYPGEGVHEVLLGDPIRLKQVLLNLLGNGIKFTAQGEVALYLNIVHTSEGTFNMQAEVRDTGIGIEEAKLKQIFEVFSQGDHSISRKYGGTGLGLSISKRLIELQSGEISVKSVLGKGTTFSFFIPYQSADIDEYKTQKEFGYEPHSDLKGKRILVVDDDEVSHVLLKPVFLQWQMAITFSSSAEEAWRLIEEESFDVLMFDLHMPIVDGRELLDRIQSSRISEVKNMKLVLCTAYVLTEEDVLIQSVDAILYKPFHYNQLWKVLSLVFNQNVFDKKESEASVLSTQTHFSLSNVWVFANGDVKQLLAFIQTFIDCSQSDLLHIHSFIEKNELKQVGELAHKLKNMCGQLEAWEVLETLRAMEGLVDENILSSDEVQNWANILEERMIRLFRALENEMLALTADHTSSL